MAQEVFVLRAFYTQQEINKRLERSIMESFMNNATEVAHPVGATTYVKLDKLVYPILVYQL